MRFRLLSAGLVVAHLALSGCATAPFPLDNAPAPVRDCLDKYARLDAVLESAGVRDAQEHRLGGFPYLRVNRFVASFRDAARTDAATRDAMLTGMVALDVHARQFERANLPDDMRSALGDLTLESCSMALTQFDRASPERMNAILDRAKVPEAYAAWKRAAGLYAITSIPFRWGARQWERSTHTTFETVPTASLTRWLPPPEESALITRHAPVFEIDARTGDDRFGAPHWTSQGIGIDAQSPVVFTQVSHTRFEGRTLAQLTYTLWFPSRPKDGPIDLLAGRLDALMVRLTLDHDGQVLVADSIHACGCYHQFFPSARLTARPAPNPQDEWAFVPALLPALKEGQRLVFRLATGSHYLTGIGVEHIHGSNGANYALRSADTLRSLPLPDSAGRRSLYGPDGFIAGTERGERFLFWPTGIASPGAMRQWGHHATAFVGRRHFDDADLMDARFARVTDNAPLKP